MSFTNEDIYKRCRSGLNTNSAGLHRVVFKHTHCFGDDPPAPAPVESTDKMMEAYNKWAGPLSEKAIEYLPKWERAMMGVKQEQAPLEQALGLKLYSEYAPQLNRVGRSIAEENAVAQSELDNRLLSSQSSKDLVSSYKQRERELSPEYYQSIGNANRLLEALTGQVMRNNTSDQLTGGETEEMQRYLNRQNNQMGNLNTGAPLNTASNALMFGRATRDRQMQNQSALSQAIQQASMVAPTMKSGADVSKLVTGKSSVPDYGASKFTGIPQVGQQYFGMQSNLLGQTGQFTGQANDINANRRDWVDRVNESLSSMPT